MKRLTDRMLDGTACVDVGDDVEITGYETTRRQIITRLAAYEDTGLTPEEIKALEYKLLGVMHSVDKWLDGPELDQDEVNRAATMREKTLRLIEDAEATSQAWISVKDRLPDPLVDVLALHVDEITGEPEITIEWVDHEKEWVYHHLGPATHWMPLPTPPKEGGA